MNEARKLPGGLTKEFFSFYVTLDPVTNLVITEIREQATFVRYCFFFC
jgi:hypothetical protein